MFIKSYGQTQQISGPYGTDNKNKKKNLHYGRKPLQKSLLIMDQCIGGSPPLISSAKYMTDPNLGG
jgi:hypothetical protein